MHTAGKYSFGSQVTRVDVCLLPELWTAERIGIDLKKFPTIYKVYEALRVIPGSTRLDITPNLN
jgi:maleylacetoacetate isomerase